VSCMWPKALSVSLKSRSFKATSQYRLRNGCVAVLLFRFSISWRNSPSDCIKLSKSLGFMSFASLLVNVDEDDVVSRRSRLQSPPKLAVIVNGVGGGSTLVYGLVCQLQNSLARISAVNRFSPRHGPFNPHLDSASDKHWAWVACRNAFEGYANAVLR